MSSPNVIEIRDKLKTFNPNSGCKKCGSFNVKTSYHSYCLGVGNDVMVRTCSVCGYIWYEKPLDDENKEEKDEVTIGTYDMILINKFKNELKP